MRLDLEFLGLNKGVLRDFVCGSVLEQEIEPSTGSGAVS